MHPPFAHTSFFSTFSGAVVKGSKPFVPWHFNCSIITLEISVMELMKKVTHISLLFIRDI